MADPDGFALDGIVVEDDIVFTLESLCRACGARETQVLELVSEGVLDPDGSGPEHWVFTGPSLRTTRIALRLLRDLELSMASVALVLDLLDQMESLKSRLRRVDDR